MTHPRTATAHLRTRRMATALAAAATIAGVLAPAAGAVSSPDAAPKAGSPAEVKVAVHAMASTAQDERRVRAHWTPERIAALNTPLSDNPPHDAADGARWRGGGAVTTTVGRLFFTDHGEDASCTATLVRSANHGTVATAAHCLNNTDAAGTAQDIAFDMPGDRTAFEFGYPRAASDPAREGLPEYTGRALAYCEGTPREYPGTPDFPEPEGIWGAPCVMGGGASGGPRFSGFSASMGHGALIGVNTQSGRMDATGAGCDDENDPACVRHLVGPRFTTALTKPLHEKAQRLR